MVYRDYDRASGITYKHAGLACGVQPGRAQHRDTDPSGISAACRVPLLSCAFPRTRTSDAYNKAKDVLMQAPTEHKHASPRVEAAQPRSAAAPSVRRT